MFSLKDYYANNSVHFGRYLNIPKKYVAAFVLNYIGAKVHYAYFDFAEIHNINTGHRKDYDALINEAILLGPAKVIVGPKTEQYNNLSLKTIAPYQNAILRGNEIIKRIVGEDACLTSSMFMLMSLLNSISLLKKASSPTILLIISFPLKIAFW